MTKTTKTQAILSLDITRPGWVFYSLPLFDDPRRHEKIIHLEGDGEAITRAVIYIHRRSILDVKFTNDEGLVKQMRFEVAPSETFKCDSVVRFDWRLYDPEKISQGIAPSIDKFMDEQIEKERYARIAEMNNGR